MTVRLQYVKVSSSCASKKHPTARRVSREVTPSSHATYILMEVGHVGMEEGSEIP